MFSGKNCNNRWYWIVWNAVSLLKGYQEIEFSPR